MTREALQIIAESRRHDRARNVRRALYDTKTVVSLENVKWQLLYRMKCGAAHLRSVLWVLVSSFILGHLHQLVTSPVTYSKHCIGGYYPKTISASVPDGLDVQHNTLLFKLWSILILLS